jgi:drug/metabolite transporter (DMT)-like permease
MKNWLFWAGVSFILGGVVSLTLNLGVTETLSSSEDLSGYAIGWMIIGAVLVGIGYIKKKSFNKQ